MSNKVEVESIQYESETTTVYGEHTFHNETISTTIVTATVQRNGVIIEGKYKFNGLLDSHLEIIKKIETLYV